MREIELKLEFDHADLARIHAHPLLAATASQQKTLHTTYYDTADLVLHKAGVSLRVRDTNGRFVQTIKRAIGNAGLFDRSEWEHEVKDRDIDLPPLKRPSRKTSALCGPCAEARTEAVHSNVASPHAAQRHQ